MSTKQDAAHVVDMAPPQDGMKDSLPAFPTWDLMWSWTGRRIRARYQQSLLGWFWAIAQPAAHAAIFTVIFTTIIPIDAGDSPYVLFAYVSIVPWTLTQTALIDMAESIVENMSLVTKIYFPREVLPLSALAARAMDFAVASSLIVILLFAYDRLPSMASLAHLPVVLTVHLVLTAGIGFLCAATNAFYRDVKPLLQLTLQIWFYASPVIYPLERVPEQYRQVYCLNPVVGLLEGYRSAWLDQPMEWALMGSSAAVSLGLLAVGYLFFNRSERLFADII